MKLRPILLLATLIVLEACQKVPITGRRQLNLVGESTLMGMASTQYADFLSQTPPLPASDGRVQEVRSIGKKLALAASDYLMANNAGDRVENFEWEFNVVEDASINAWAMPGGKVVVYTGIMKVTQDPTGLAVVMGHEIAHAIARHGNERMSQGLALQGAGMTLDVLTQQKPGLARDLFMQSIGIGGQLGMLAYSRQHESEADRMGLIFMAMAGYDPREAPKFWQRMSQASEGGGKPPEILSTHPSDQTRMEDLEKYMADALKYYKP